MRSIRCGTIGRTEIEVETWLNACYGLDSSKQIRRRAYVAICSAIEGPGPLPTGQLGSDRHTLEVLTAVPSARY